MALPPGSSYHGERAGCFQRPQLAIGPGEGRDGIATLMSLVGLAGSAFIIVSYFANQQGWMSSTGVRFLVLNLCGSALILVSLFYQWNLPSVVIETFWAAISLYGLVLQTFRRPA